MNFPEGLDPHHLSLAGKTGMGTAGLVVLVLAFKVGRFLFKLILGLVALALLGGAAWWFFLKQ